MSSDEEPTDYKSVRAFVPSHHARRKKKRCKPVGFATLLSRHNNGLDLWTGRPLEGKYARNWMYLWLWRVEEVHPDKDKLKNVVRLVEASPKRVVALRDDGIMIRADRMAGGFDWYLGQRCGQETTWQRKTNEKEEVAAIEANGLLAADSDGVRVCLDD